MAFEKSGKEIDKKFDLGNNQNPHFSIGISEFLPGWKTPSNNVMKTRVASKSAKYLI